VASINISKHLKKLHKLKQQSVESISEGSPLIERPTRLQSRLLRKIYIEGKENPADFVRDIVAPDATDSYRIDRLNKQLKRWGSKEPSFTPNDIREAQYEINHYLRTQSKLPKKLKLYHGGTLDPLSAKTDHTGISITEHHPISTSRSRDTSKKFASSPHSSLLAAKIPRSKILWDYRLMPTGFPDEQEFLVRAADFKRHTTAAQKAVAAVKKVLPTAFSKKPTSPTPRTKVGKALKKIPAKYTVANYFDYHTNQVSQQLGSELKKKLGSSSQLGITLELGNAQNEFIKANRATEFSIEKFLGGQIEKAYNQELKAGTKKLKLLSKEKPKFSPKELKYAWKASVHDYYLPEEIKNLPDKPDAISAETFQEIDNKKAQFNTTMLEAQRYDWDTNKYYAGQVKKAEAAETPLSKKLKRLSKKIFKRAAKRVK